jgi:hypothetical protein
MYSLTSFFFRRQLLTGTQQTPSSVIRCQLFPWQQCVISIFFSFVHPHSILPFCQIHRLHTHWFQVGMIVGYGDF